jgi:hypothetical protein
MNTDIMILDAPTSGLIARVLMQRTKDKVIKISQNLLETKTF